MCNNGILKRFPVFGLLLVWCGLMAIGEVKIVDIPDDIKIEENVAKETVVRNLTEEGELFHAHPIFLIDGYFYLARRKPVELIKLTMDGKIIGRAGRKGQGPGETLRVWTIREYKGNLALLDYKRMRVILYTKDLKFLKEYQLPKMYMGFLVDKQNRFVLYGEPNSMADYYFSIYTGDCQYLRSFGEVKASFFSGAVRRKKGSSDAVRRHVIIPGEDGIWASFMNRYDLRYYIKEKLAVEIKAPKDFFKAEEKMGERHTYTTYTGRSAQLAKYGDLLYYYYGLDKKFYCDIFDLSTYRLSRRIKFKRKYIYIMHFKEKTFYALGYQLDEEDEDYDVVLYRFEL